MKIRINKIKENTQTEGPGNRTSIYVQGCLQECKGCNTPETWDMNSGTEYDVNSLADIILENNEIEGVTFTGGEPLLQSKALYELGSILKKHNLSIIIFTGYSYDVIEDINDANWNNLFSVTDILISGPYIEEENTTTKWEEISYKEYEFFSDRYASLKEKLN